MRFVLLTTVLLACGATDPGPARPAGRWLGAMAYDTAAHHVVLLTGSNANSTMFYDDSWAWDGAHWTPLSSHGPGERDGALVAYAPNRQRILVFGGRSPQAQGGVSVALTDTWEGNGTSWTRVSSAGPGDRKHFNGGFDAGRNTLVLFGGSTNTVPTGTVLTDTWEWNGQQWNQMSTSGATGSSLTDPSTAVYLPGRGKLVMLIGTFSAGPSEIWEWNGTAWSVVGTGPTGSMPMPLVATGDNTMLIFDGGSGITYVWNGTTTTQVASTGPGARDLAAMAYDASRQRVVLFGGRRGNTILADTWLWDGSAWSLTP